MTDSQKAHVRLNTDPANETDKDTGLYELYENVVVPFVDGMIAEAERYAGKDSAAGVHKFNDSAALPVSSYFYTVRAKADSLYSPYSPVVSRSR